MLRMRLGDLLARMADGGILASVVHVQTCMTCFVLWNWRIFASSIGKDGLRALDSVALCTNLVIYRWSDYLH